MEIWKNIIGYETLYKISENGIVVSLKTNKIKAQTSNNAGNGYYYVCLYKNNVQRKHYIHRLLAINFITNPESKPQVNHKDGNTKNNKIDNLEWVTFLENILHSINTLNNKDPYKIANVRRKKKVNQLTISGESVSVYESANEASRKTGIACPYIINCCNNKQSHAKGYRWQYIEVQNGNII